MPNAKKLSKCKTRETIKQKANTTTKQDKKKTKTNKEIEKQKVIKKNSNIKRA